MSFMGNMTGNKAYGLHVKGKYQEALALYDDGYKKGMDKAKLLRSYIALLVRAGRFDDAIECIKKIKTLPDFTEKDRFDVRTNYAILLWKQGRVDTAIDILSGQMKEKKSGVLYSILGCVIMDCGDRDEALRFNQEALDYDNEDPVYLDNMGQTLYRLFDEKEKAKPYFDKAIKLKPEAIDTNYFLALYDLEQGDKESARRHLETSAKGYFSPLNYATPEKVRELLEKTK